MQLTLFPSPRSIPPTDPQVEPIEIPRLRGQNAAILERLQQGPATNRELCNFALNYRARISDLRKAGYTVVVDEDKATGLNVYTLEHMST